MADEYPTGHPDDDIWYYAPSTAGLETAHGGDWMQLENMSSPISTNGRSQTSQSPDDEAEDPITLDYSAIGTGHESETNDAFVFMPHTDEAPEPSKFELTEFSVKSENSTNFASVVESETEPLIADTFGIELDPFL